MVRGGSRGAKKPSLGSLSRETHRDKPSVQPWLEEFKNASDRSAALVGAAYLANALQDYIQRTMRMDLEEAVATALFHEARAPLSDFSSRIEVAYAFGLIVKEDREDLHRVRRIRNVFAHSALQIDFHHELIAKECAALTFGNIKASLPAIPRQRYFARVIALSLAIEKKSHAYLSERIEKLLAPDAVTPTPKP